MELSGIIYIGILLHSYIVWGVGRPIVDSGVCPTKSIAKAFYRCCY